MPFKQYLSWNCDFCGKPCITISLAGIIYCDNCKKSYGEQLFKDHESKIFQILKNKK